jgi:CheY-like chemotaxis protein
LHWEARSLNVRRDADRAASSDVLVVDDNLIIATDTEDMLSKIGVTIVRVASGVEEALRLIEQQLHAARCQSA